MVVSGGEWDESLFEGAAPYYARGRLPYAPGFADVLAEALGLDGTGRLLDVGCGPGTLALALAGSFAEVVGVDPDPGMLMEAGRNSPANARWIRARAEQLPLGLGTFEAATFGNSFQWMDQDLVAATIRGMLRPGGAFVHVADDKSEVRTHEGLPCPPAPADAIGALVTAYLGPEQRAGRGILRKGTPGGEAGVLARAGFAGPERHVVPGGQELLRDEDDVVAWVFSMSFSAPHLYGERRGAFEADLRALLREASPARRFSTRQPATELRVWRSPSA